MPPFAPHSSEAWRCRACPVPAPQPNAIDWTGRASTLNPTRLTIWHSTVVFISLVQKCYRDLMQITGTLPLFPLRGFVNL
jgi:hypothetical protein